MRHTTVNAAFLKRPGIWSRSHYLDRMNLRDLVAAYFQYYAIQAYLLLAVAAAGLAVWKPSGAVQNVAAVVAAVVLYPRSEEHTSALQSLMRISYAVFCLKKTTQLATYISNCIIKN